MDSAKIAYERVDSDDSIVRIPLANIKDSNFIMGVLRDTCEACFENGDAKFIIDLDGMDLPSPSLIALLIEITSRARSVKGDVKIVNLSNRIKSYIDAFSPRSFLSLEDDEQDAVSQFSSVHEEDENQSDAREPDQEIFSTVDIADDPIIAKLENRVIEKPSSGDDSALPPEAFTPAEQKGERNHLRVKSLAKNLYTICDFVIEYAGRAGFDSKMIGKMRIAVYEACLNVIEHAYHSNPENWIDVWIEYNMDMFKVVIQDYGNGFDGFSESKFDVVSAMDGRQTGGFGLYIIRRSMDKVEYRPDPKHGNRLTMIKFLRKQEAGA